MTELPQPPEETSDDRHAAPIAEGIQNTDFEAAEKSHSGVHFFGRAYLEKAAPATDAETVRQALLEYLSDADATPRFAHNRAFLEINIDKNEYGFGLLIDLNKALAVQNTTGEICGYDEVDIEQANLIIKSLQTLIDQLLLGIKVANEAIEAEQKLKEMPS